MNNKVWLVLVAAVVLVAAAGFILMNGDDDDEVPDGYVCYHGNGGYAGFNHTDKYTAANTTYTPCPFENGDMAFYMWNTEANGTGDYYSDRNIDLIAESGVKDLYAIWVNSFHVDLTESWSNFHTITAKLFSESEMFLPQVIDSIDCFLDPNMNSASIVFSAGEDLIWEASDDFMTFTATGSKCTYKVQISDVTGASDFSVGMTTDGTFNLNFVYSDNVSMGLSLSTGLLKH